MSRSSGPRLAKARQKKPKKTYAVLVALVFDVEQQLAVHRVLGEGGHGFLDVIGLGKRTKKKTTNESLQQSVPERERGQQTSVEDFEIED